MTLTYASVCGAMHSYGGFRKIASLLKPVEVIA
jgi:hypothetical protein